MRTSRLASGVGGAAALAALALSLGVDPAAAQEQPPTVAVFDFRIGTSQTVRVEVSEDGSDSSATVSAERQTSLLTNKLIADLAKTRDVAVVERKKMNKIMEEVSLSKSDLTDPQRATEVGELVGADYMVFGSVTLFEPAVSVKELAYDAGQEKTISMTVGATIRLVDAETGKVKTAADMRAKDSATQVAASGLGRYIPQSFMDDVVNDLTGKLAQRIVNRLNPIEVAKQTGDTVYLARAGLSEGKRYRVVEQGEAIRDPDTGEVIGRTSRKIAVIEITDTFQDVSKAEVTRWLIDTRSIPRGSVCRPI